MIIKTSYGTFDTNGSRIVVKVFDYERKKIYRSNGPADPLRGMEESNFFKEIFYHRDVVLPSFY